MYIIKSIVTASLISSIMLSLPAQADFFSKFKDVTDIVKQTGVLDAKTTPTESAPAPSSSPSNSGGNTRVSAKNQEMPMGLTAYPRAELVRRIDNPFAQTITPLSRPKLKKFPNAQADYNLTAEGKVTWLQFTHETDDSPLLIIKYYESWLASNGFERLLICAAPCNSANGDNVNGGMYWGTTIDPEKRLLDEYAYDATVIVGLKNNAVAFITVGRDNQGRHEYRSLVKTIEGRIIDDSAWKKLMTPVAPLPVVEPSQSAPATQANTASAAMMYAQQVSPYDLLPNIKSSKGLVVVHLSSFDKGCGYCVGANPQFDALAGRYKSQQVKFWQSGAQPWQDSLKNDFAKKYKVYGVPATLLFKDGKLSKRVEGVATTDELERQLLKDSVPANVAPSAEDKNTPISGVQVLRENGAEQMILLSKGVTFVHVSTYDEACTICTSASASYDELAARYAGKGEFYLMTVSQLAEAQKSKFVSTFGVKSVPATLVFKDRKLAKVVYGAATVDELDSKLVKDGIPSAQKHGSIPNNTSLASEKNAPIGIKVLKEPKEGDQSIIDYLQQSKGYVLFNYSQNIEPPTYFVRLSKLHPKQVTYIHAIGTFTFAGIYKKYALGGFPSLLLFKDGQLIRKQSYPLPGDIDLNYSYKLNENVDLLERTFFNNL